MGLGNQFSMGNVFILPLRRNEDTFGNTLRIPMIQKSQNQKPSKGFMEKTNAKYQFLLISLTKGAVR
jgi:hypothetical protein